MIGRKLFAALGVALFAAGLMGVPALAKCRRPCKSQIATAFRTCKKACPKRKAGRDCRKACSDAKKASTKSCKAATNPTPPACSSSAAFVDDLSAF
jgi:hypothetical protein